MVFIISPASTQKREQPSILLVSASITLFNTPWILPRILARGTDAAVVNRLAQELRAAAADPEIQGKFVDQGAIVITNSPAEAAERMRGEAQVWKSIIDKTGVKLSN